MRVRKTVLALLALVVGGAGYALLERIRFDRGAWLADYDQLRTHVSRNYANLLWVVNRRGLDPTELHRATLEKLHAADTDRAARAALSSFVAAFQDAHFRVARVRLSQRIENLFAGKTDEIAANTAPGEACAALGFEGEDAGLAFGLSARATPDNAFSSAVFDLGTKKAGMLRIPIFDQKNYRGACQRAWSGYAGARHCDGACIATFIESVVPNRLLSELAAQVRALEEAGAALLVVDITANGGGTDWVEPAARIVAGKPLACAHVSFIKGPHWLNTFSEITRKIDRDLAADQNSGDIALLQVARRRAVEFADRAGATCPLDGVWENKERPACSNLVEDTAYTACGLMGPLPKGSLARAQSAGALFHGLGFDYEESVFSGPVVVLIDGASASAAEYFAAILADNDVAVLVGRRTWGLGCGYTNGGVGVLLNRSGMKVEMPDCQRLRRDGTNEMAGVAPHIEVDWKDEDGDTERWSKLKAVLAPLVE